MASLRLESAGDAPRLRELLEASFPGPDEADLVDNLRRDGDTVLSLVAEADGFVVGYVLFSRISINGEAGSRQAVALAPLAVLTQFQKQGIGTRLVREAHARLGAMGETLSIVVGEPGYYSRFGYSHCRAARFESEYQSPYLMALSFGAAPWEGRLVYPRAFSLLSEYAPLQADDRI
jgi:putative acetyltransferase